MNDITNQIDVLALKIATLNKEQNNIKTRYLQISGEIVHILESIANIVESSYGEFFLQLPEKSADIISMYESKEEPKRRGRPKKAVISLQSTVEEPRQEPKKRGRPKKDDSINHLKFESFDKMILSILSDPIEKYRNILSNYPQGAKGLKLTEINDIILKNEMWDFVDVNSFKKIQNSIYQLKDSGKIKRNDQDRRYYLM
jgi:hypothetical protein